LDMSSLFVRSLALLLPSSNRLGINTGGNTEGGTTRENHFSTLLLSRGAAVGAFRGRLRILGWAHFAVAVVVLVIDG